MVALHWLLLIIALFKILIQQFLFLNEELPSYKHWVEPTVLRLVPHFSHGLFKLVEEPELEFLDIKFFWYFTLTFFDFFLSCLHIIGLHHFQEVSSHNVLLNLKDSVFIDKGHMLLFDGMILQCLKGPINGLSTVFSLHFPWKVVDSLRLFLLIQPCVEDSLNALGLPINDIRNKNTLAVIIDSPDTAFLNLSCVKTAPYKSSKFEVPFLRGSGYRIHNTKKQINLIEICAYC